MSDERDPFRTNDRRVIPWLILGLLALFGAVYVAGYLLTSDRVPWGTTVSGIKVGGLTPAEAETKLRTGLEGRAAEPISVIANDQRVSIMPASVGLLVDVPATVERAGGGRSWDPARIWGFFFSASRDLDAVVSVDADALDRGVDRIAEQVDVPATEGSIVFTRTQAKVRYPQKGIVLDRPAAAQQLRTSFLNSPDAVELPTETAEPDVSKAEVSRVMERFANPALSAAVVVRLAGKQVRVQPAEFAPALSVDAVGDRLHPRIDHRVLGAVLDATLRPLRSLSKDASFRVVGAVPSVIPSRRGADYDPKVVARGFLRVLGKSGEERVLEARNVAARPRLSTQGARRLRVTERVSSASTTFAYSPERNFNLSRAADLVTGTLVKPGMTFSLDAALAEGSAGFTEGFAVNTGSFAERLGGGAGQVAATLFDAAFFAGLDAVEHTPHRFYAGRYPAGREATFAAGTTDLRFKNSTPYGVLIQADVVPSSTAGPGVVTVSMYSTRYWYIRTQQSGRSAVTPPDVRRSTGPGCVPDPGRVGFDVDVTRLFYRAGSSKVDHRETMHTHYVPTDTVVCA